MTTIVASMSLLPTTRFRASHLDTALLSLLQSRISSASKMTMESLSPPSSAILFRASILDLANGINDSITSEPPGFGSPNLFDVDDDDGITDLIPSEPPGTLRWPLSCFGMNVPVDLTVWFAVLVCHFQSDVSDQGRVSVNQSIRGGLHCVRERVWVLVGSSSVLSVL
jgi:hypothetical protein